MAAAVAIAAVITALSTVAIGRNWRIKDWKG